MSEMRYRPAAIASAAQYVDAAPALVSAARLDDAPDLPEVARLRPDPTHDGRWIDATTPET